MTNKWKHAISDEYMFIAVKFYNILHCDTLNHFPNRLSMIQVLSDFLLFKNEVCNVARF